MARQRTTVGRKRSQPRESKPTIISSDIPPWQLLHLGALDRVARRCEVGLKQHGDNAWNGISANQAVLNDVDIVCTRLAHGMRHAALLIQKLQATKRGEAFDKSDDDAAAVMWAGMLACAATQRFMEADHSSHAESGSKLVGQKRSPASHRRRSRRGLHTGATTGGTD